MLHGFENCLAVKKLPRRGYDRCRSVAFTQKIYRIRDLLIGCPARMRKHDRGCGANLIHIKLAKILGVHLALARIGYRAKASENHLIGKHGRNRPHNVRKLTDTRGLDQYAIGMILLQNLAERFSEIADKRATNASGIHLRDIDARFLQKAAVNTDLSEFVFNQNDLLARIRFLQKLFDQSGFTRAEKAGKNIYFCHL